IVGIALGGGPLGPAAALLQCLRQIPMIEAEPRLDAGLFQRVDEAAVIVEPARVGLAAAGRLHAGPRDREAIGLEPGPLDQRDVLGIAAVRVTGDVAAAAVLDLAGLAAKAVP